MESLLFILTGNPRWITFIGATTLTSWLMLSDFFMAARFSWWQFGWEEWVFVGLSVLVTALIVGCHYTFVRRGLVAAAPRIELVPTGKFFTADTVAVVLSAVANNKPLRQPRRLLFWKVTRRVPSDQARRFLLWGVTRKVPSRYVRRCFFWMVTRNVPSHQTRRFLVWKVKRIEQLDPQREMTRPWWSSWNWRVVGRWVAALWFPALLIVLYGAPSMPLFERLVSQVTGYRMAIFNVAAEGLNPGPPPGARTRTGIWVKESLVRDTAASAWCRSATALVTTGTLTLSTTRFPHLSHRLLAVCAGDTPNCAIALNGQAPVPDADIPVRNGRAQLQFHQVTADWHLNMIVRLQRPNGTIVEQTVIDPAVCR